MSKITTTVENKKIKLLDRKFKIMIPAEEIDKAVERVAEKLRAMSPVWINGKPDLTAAADLHH